MAEARKKTSKAIAATPKFFAERMDGVWAQVPGTSIRLLLKGLTWPEQERIDTMISVMMQEARDAHPDSQPDPEDYDFQVASMWRLRLGVHEVEGLDDLPEFKTKEIQIGGVKRTVYPAEFYAKIDPEYTRQLYAKIDELTGLSQSEKKKLDFTTPQ